MTFQVRQSSRKAKRERHQRRMAKLMKSVGGYRSSMWNIFISKIQLKIMRRIQMAHARKEAKISNTL